MPAWLRLGRLARLNVWSDLLVPAKTPATVVGLLSREIGEVLKQPEVQAPLTEAGYRVVDGDPAAFARFIAVETDKYKCVVQLANIQASD